MVLERLESGYIHSQSPRRRRQRCGGRCHQGEYFRALAWLGPARLPNHPRTTARTQGTAQLFLAPKYNQGVTCRSPQMTPCLPARAEAWFGPTGLVWLFLVIIPPGLRGGVPYFPQSPWRPAIGGFSDPHPYVVVLEPFAGPGRSGPTSATSRWGPPVFGGSGPNLYASTLVSPRAFFPFFVFLDTVPPAPSARYLHTISTEPT